MRGDPHRLQKIAEYLFARKAAKEIRDLEDERIIQEIMKKMKEPITIMNADETTSRHLPVQTNFNQLAAEIHQENRKWWYTKEGVRLNRNEGELLCLMHSELSEAMEAVRKDLMDDKLPHRKGVEVELADLIIRVMDYAGAKHLDLDGAIQEKRAFNRVRVDHTYEAREGANGKKF
jgi:hypothetical protein